MAMNGEDCGC